MKLSNEQIEMLVGMVVSTEEDHSDCDSCFERLAEFAEIELLNRDIPDAMQAIRVHLEQCPCCQMEFDALMQALKSMGGSCS